MPPPGTDGTERMEPSTQLSILPGGVMTPPYKTENRRVGVFSRRAVALIVW